MITQELVSYIKTSKEKGVPLEVIKSNLLSAGWNQSDVNEALLSLAPVPVTPIPPTPTPAAVPVSSVSPAAPMSFMPKASMEPVLVHKKSNLLSYIIVAVILIVLGAGAAYAYIQKIGPFATTSVAYDSSNFLSGLLAQSSKINTTSYSASASLKVGPRDADAHPFVLPALSDEFLKKYKNDVTRASNVQAILSSMSSFQYSSKVYPATLEKLKAKTGASLYRDTFSLTDPATLKTYQYALIDSGKDFNLTVTFETDDAVSAIRRSYGFKPETTLIDGKNVTFTKDSKTYIYLSPEPAKPFFATLGDEAKYLPAEFGADLTFSAKTNAQTGDLANWVINVDANGDFGDLSYKFNVDGVKKDSDYYLKINNIPSIFLGSFSNLKGEWIKISSKKKDATATGDYQSYDPLSSMSDSLSKWETSYRESRTEFMDLLKKATQFADEEGLITFKSQPKTEKVGDRDLTRYDLGVNRDAIIPFYKKLIAEATLTKNFQTIFEDNGILTYLETPEFQNVFDYYQANTFLSVWLDSEGFPAIIKYTFRLVPPDSADQLIGKQANLVLTLNITDINKPINIEAPSGAKNIEDIPAFKTAKSNGANASIKANLSNMRASAEIYYDTKSSYGTTVNNNCAATSGTLFADKYMAGSITSIKKSMGDAGASPAVINCYSSKTAWAVSAKLVDDSAGNGYWCVDSSGYSKNILKPISSTACSK
ncbi:MAG: hypothetical protein WCI76_02760 [bacterium]